MQLHYILKCQVMVSKPSPMLADYLKDFLTFQLSKYTTTGLYDHQFETTSQVAYEQRDHLSVTQYLNSRRWLKLANMFLTGSNFTTIS